MSKRRSFTSEFKAEIVLLLSSFSGALHVSAPDRTRIPMGKPTGLTNSTLQWLILGALIQTCKKQIKEGRMLPKKLSSVAHLLGSPMFPKP
jgi:hypothetical protein